MAAKAFFTLVLSVLFLMSCNVLGFPNSGINVCNITLQNQSCNVTHAMFSKGSVSLKITLRQDVNEVTVRYTVQKQCSAGEMCFREVSFGGKIGMDVPNIEPMESCILANKSEGQKSVPDSTQEPAEGDDTENKGDDTGNKGDDTGNKGDDTGNKGDDTGNKGDDTGNKGDDTGNKGDDTGNKGDDTGNKGDDTGNKGNDTGVNPEGKSQKRKRDSPPDGSSPPPASPQPASPPPVIRELAEDGIYMVKIEVLNLNITSEQKKRNENRNATNSTLLEVHVTMKNPRGFLDAADYPYLVFYSLMFVGYFFLGIIWSICMCCSCKDLIRLQLFIGVAIIMGFAEKLFFVVEYGYVDNTGSRYTDSIIPLLIIAEAISAGKKTFARVLLIIISSGFGTVKPRLGSLLWKVFIFGGVFYAVTLADGFARAYYYTPLEGFNKYTTISAVIQVVLDTILLYWIISNLIDTRRTLRLRRNYKKLAFYNHLLVTFVIVAIGVLAFLLWIFITGLMDSCSQDWKGFWLRECFWPLLFTILLVVIMILWRPSSNAVRFAYSAVSNEDEEEIQQKANENFETMKMRHGSRSDVMPPKPSAETEEDLKWVEENLPASTIDRVLQPLMDSDEELMTTRFERSKMD